MSSGYRDELEALRAQLDATRTELAETRDDLERTRKARDDAEQRLAQALARADADDNAVARAPDPPARRRLHLRNGDARTEAAHRARDAGATTTSMTPARLPRG